MTYKLPAPEVIGVAGWWDDGIGYTADQMQAAYQAGRDSMKAECVKVCEEQYEYYGYDHIFAKKIKELK